MPSRNYHDDTRTRSSADLPDTGLFLETKQLAGSSKDKELVRKLINARIFREYRRAFGTATGLPLSFEPAEGVGIAHADDPSRSPVRFLLAGHDEARVELLRFQNMLQEKARTVAATVCSPYGITQTAIPVTLGDRVIGHLHTGQVFLGQPTFRQARKVLRELRKAGLQLSIKKFVTAYKRTPVLDRRVYEGIIRMLEFFALQIAALANEIVLQQTKTVPANIERAREFIAEHYEDELRLTTLAAHLGLSPFAFCKQFKQATAVTFKDYVARLRVEKSKAMLLNPKYRVSEAAYQSGFQSLSNFNRHFRRITGQSPRQFRDRLNQLAATTGRS